MLYLVEKIIFGKLWVRFRVLRRSYSARSHTFALHYFHYLLGGMVCRPFSYISIKLIAVVYPALDSAEFNILRPYWISHHLTKALPFIIRLYGDSHPSISTFAAVCPVGRGTGALITL